MKTKKILHLLLLASTFIACNQFTATPTATLEKPIIETVTVTSTSVPTEESNDPTVGSSGLGDSLYPDFGNGGYNVIHYTLDITVNDVSTSDLTAITAIEAQSTQDLRSFNLDFIGFDIMSLTVNDQPADFDRVGRELIITPSKQLAEDELFTVVVQYQGSPNQMQSAALPFQTGWVTVEGGSFVLSEPDGSASYYPVNDHPLDKAAYTFRVTVPEPYEVAANGVLTETIDNGDTNTFLFEAHDPMASYLATINIDELDLETMEPANGIPIRNYYSRGLPAEVRKPFARQGEMLIYFSELFGPYPFEIYGAFVMDTQFGAALENQTMSIFGMDMVDIDDIEGTELVVAHELAHQWFGDSVSLADWSDIWLNEGFATYGEGLWIEHLHGRDALDEWVKGQYSTVNEFPEYFPPPGNPEADNLFNGGVYLRGGLTLHALRLEVGDETFFEVLKTYHENYKGGNVTTDDFIDVAEDVSNKDLQAFFDGWLNETKMPSIPELGLGTE